MTKEKLSSEDLVMALEKVQNSEFEGLKAEEACCLLLERSICLKLGGKQGKMAITEKGKDILKQNI